LWRRGMGDKLRYRKKGERTKNIREGKEKE
jgi:hypothetical protein